MHVIVESTMECAISMDSNPERVFYSSIICVIKIFYEIYWNKTMYHFQSTAAHIRSSPVIYVENVTEFADKQ